MSETQEIDALLISALYGELTPAEETALEAHLVSHPADKSALEALTTTRDAVRASRILQVQLDPPQSVSALLLQEAARRAPKPEKQEGWFARLARSFMMHPAMAAAAMLVVVIGTVTLVQNRKGDQYAETAPARSVSTQPAQEQGVFATRSATPDQAENQAADAPAPSAGSAAGSAAPVTGERERFGATDGKDDYRVSLADSDQGVNGQALKQTNGVAEKQKAEKPSPAKAEPAADESVAKNAKAPATKKPPSGSYMELRSPEPTVKDLEESPGVAFEGRQGYAQAPAAADRTETANAVAPAPSGGTGKSPGGSAGAASSTTSAPQASPTPVAKAGESQAAGKREVAAPRNVAPPAAPPPPPPAPKVADSKTIAPAEDKANDPQLAWAREQHNAIIARVRSGDCKGAATIAVGLANRDLAYYRQNVASDRSVKDCLAYIDNARERDQEQRAERNKAAAPKRSTNEPAKKAADTAESK